MIRDARTWASLLLAAVLAVLVVLLNPTTSGRQLRSMLGLGQDLTFTITDHGAGTGYTFALLEPDGREPVRWSSCAPIRYVVNPDGAPAGDQRLVAAAVADVAGASGLSFRYEGTTGDRRFEGRSGVVARPPVLIGWATPAEVAALAGDAAGAGAAEPVTTSPGHLGYVTGMVALDRDAVAAMDPAHRQAVIEHELGHLLGLGHADDPAQLMYGETTSRTRLGSGDRAGLALLGGGPCA